MRSRVSKLRDRFVERGLWLAVAESMTGGALSDLITSVRGASDYFLGGVVCYSPELKRMLGVKRGTLERFGAYSEEVAVALAKGAMRTYKADVAVGITGIAHPDRGHRSPGAWVAVAFKGKVRTRHFACRAGVRRNEARKKVANTALELLLETLKMWRAGGPR